MSHLLFLCYVANATSDAARLPRWARFIVFVPIAVAFAAIVLFWRAPVWVCSAFARGFRRGVSLKS